MKSKRLTRREFLVRFATLSATAVALTGCDDFFPESRPLYGVVPAYGPPLIETDPPDSVGNLVIINNSGTILILYADGVREKVISTTSASYLVNIPNPEKATIELWLFRYEDIAYELDDPPIAFIFAQRSVILPDNTDSENRVIWSV